MFSDHSTFHLRPSAFPGGTVLSPAVITSLGTSSGTEIGGNTVTINGSGFSSVSGPAGVKFGGVNAQSYTVISDSRIDAVVPAISDSTTFPSRAVLGDYRDHALSSTAADNAVSVTVTNPLGSSTLESAYTYTSEIARILGSRYSKEHRANDPRIALNGGNVSSWPDYAGNGAAVQATGANQPAFSATSFNGGPGITFDGSNDYLDATLTSAIAAGSRAYVLVAFARVSGANGARIVLLQPTSAGDDALFIGYGTTNFEAYRQRNGLFDRADTGALLDVSRHVVEGAFAANGDPTLRWDGVNKATSTPHDYVPDSDLTHLVVAAQKAGAPSAFSNTTIAHVVVANDMPTAQQLADIRAFVTGAYWRGYTSSSLGLS